ncbi:hypothetical protein SAMN02745126_06241 [Enhydrobacter aerosaccus]|uniref:DUF1109 domain-containing protein n=1 Tax=Enhydrobacter aerosaccus TaxID=225324 RepID=A0A1T4TG54_9HYPH|nr:NrsF family protein [Enhydrobacter aerosaccus]SKA39465.1 hypothetical protein SAMN02745126_06241 [Enhydrobacter aerosaccus]
MKTEQLVAALVADGGRAGRPIAATIARALAAGLAVSLAIFAVTLGPRVDLMPALETWRFDLKLVLVAVAVMAAGACCLAFARPQSSAHWRLCVALLVVLAAGALAAELSVLPRGQWMISLVGSNALVCTTAIPLFSLAPLVGLLLALRRTAPASPMLAGAAAGAFAATCAAVIYAFHCFDDSPLFVLVWYPLAMVPAVTVGAVLGRRLLRW